MSTVLSISNLAAGLSSPAAPVETGLQSIRAQAALVRSLLDELEELAPPSGSSRFASSVAAQTGEELAQLACKMMVAASFLAPQSVAAMKLQHWPVPVAYTEY
jgi:hypothetical protein